MDSAKAAEGFKVFFLCNLRKIRAYVLRLPGSKIVDGRTIRRPEPKTQLGRGPPEKFNQMTGNRPHWACREGPIPLIVDILDTPTGR